MLSVLLFATGSLASNKEIIAASIGAAGTVIGGILTIIGGRRRTGKPDHTAVMDVHDMALCEEVNEHFARNYLAKFAGTMLTDKPMLPTVVELADSMAGWCAGASRRRIEEGENEWQEFLEELEDVVKTSAQSRRLDDNVMRRLRKKMTNFGYQQCAGYAAAVAYIAEQSGKEKSAHVFAVNSKGAKKERIDGCGSVVNFVNNKIEETPGLSIEKDANGVEIVVVSNDIADRFGKVVTLVTAASGAMFYKLFSLCDRYTDLIDIA